MKLTIMHYISMAIIVILLALTIYFIGIKSSNSPAEEVLTTPEFEHIGPTTPPHSEGPDGPPPIQ